MIRKQRKGRIGVLKLLAAVVLLAVIGMSNIPGMGMVSIVHAEGEKTITGLGTGAIGNPNAPERNDSPWSGSYVYYGKYENNPVKYRILDASTDRFNSDDENTAGIKKMFLDCDSVLFADTFRDNWEASDANVWKASDLYKRLNTDSDSLLNTGFTPTESNAIAGSYIDTHALTSDSTEPGAVNVAVRTKDAFVNYTALEGEKIFLLDAEDASNNVYGYSTTNDPVENRIKAGSWWWLRSPYSSNDIFAGVVVGNGIMDLDDVDYPGVGVSPAFNVNLSSVIFSSLISSESDSYKLTLKDDNLGIMSGSVTRDGATITVPYTITGTNASNATQVSVLVMDGEYSAGTVATSGYTYMKLAVDSWTTTGTGIFTLPNGYADKTWGTDYRVYILAEDVNDEKETDYASAPVEIKAVTASATGY